MKTKKPAVIGILAALICVLAPLSVPAGAVPISLATFAVYIISCTVNKKYSTAAVIIYILLGTAGLPVFSAFTGGFQQITGISGGYIIGYIPCSFLIGLLTDKFENKKSIYPLSMILGTCICYLFGTFQYMFYTKSDFTAALGICALPFLIGDAVKITAASIIGFTLRKKLKKILL